MPRNNWSYRTQKVLEALALGLEVPLAGRRCVAGQDEQGRTVLACVAQVWKGAVYTGERLLPLEVSLASFIVWCQTMPEADFQRLLAELALTTARPAESQAE
jgi:hypothetical protein